MDGVKGIEKEGGGRLGVYDTNLLTEALDTFEPEHFFIRKTCGKFECQLSMGGTLELGTEKVIKQ